MATLNGSDRHDHRGNESPTPQSPVSLTGQQHAFRDNNNHPTVNTSLVASSNMSASSLKEMKKNYHMRKKFFTKNVQSAIESSQEVHSGWLKARTSFKRWTKVWCQVKPGYLILYTSQEALKKHRLGVVLLSVCQVIKRPTKKDGFCFKLINPFGCSVWAKSSTKALVFSQTSLTLRVSDNSIGRLWLDALHQCHLSSNLEGYQAVVDEDGFARDVSAHALDNMSDSDDADQSDRNFDSLLNHSNSMSDINSTISTLNNNNNNNSQFELSKRPAVNGSIGAPVRHNAGIESKLATSSKLDVHSKTRVENQDFKQYPTSHKIDISNVKDQHNHSSQTHESSPNTPRPDSCTSRSGITGNQSSLNYAKMVSKFSKYSWRELQLEGVHYVEDSVEEFNHAGSHIEEVQEGNKHLLWHLIKQLRPGMDLSKVTLPTFILEPRSFLERLADYYYHSDILSDAVLIDDPVMRFTNIVKWYLSGFYKMPKGPKKPYNPILGERFRCFWDHPKTKSRTFFVAEQVSHHPPITAFHVANRKDGYTLSCALLSKSKFNGNSVSAILDGKAKLFLNKRNETYILSMPYANCRGILLGSLCLELGGKVEIECFETKCKCELDFKLAPIWGGSDSYNVLSGKILRDNKLTHVLDGHWNKRIDIVDKSTNKKSTLWEVTDAVKSSRLKRYTVSLKDQDERESVKLWSKVTAALVEGNQTDATAEKTILEDMQRKEAKERLGVFEPKHFHLPSRGMQDWPYRWQDDRVWNDRRDIMQFEEDFKIRTLMMDCNNPITPLIPTIDLPIKELSKFSSQVKDLVVDVQRAQMPGGSRPFSVSELSPDTVKSIESKIAAGNLLFEEAIKQVTEKNKKLEEDIAVLQRARSKRTMALIMTAMIIGLISAFYKYFI